MSERMESRTISVWIDRPFAAAYAFLSPPENFPKWASGLCKSIERVNSEWIAETPTGPMRVRFSPPNEFGVLDHTVIPPDGAEIFVPLRVISNGTGCELALTLFRQPDTTDEKFEEDATWVSKDLRVAKAELEAR